MIITCIYETSVSNDDDLYFEDQFMQWMALLVPFNRWFWLRAVKLQMKPILCHHHNPSPL